MRKFFRISLCLFLTLLILTGCNPKKKLIHTVIETNDTSLLVEDNEKGRYYVSVNEEMEILDSNGEVIKITEIKVCDKLIITHNGKIRESDPAKFEKIYKIRIQKNES